jgi:hypothetical protein
MEFGNIIINVARAFFKKLQLLGLCFNEGLFPTQFYNIRVHKNHSVLRGSASAIYRDGSSMIW